MKRVFLSRPVSVIFVLCLIMVAALPFPAAGAKAFASSRADITADFTDPNFLAAVREELGKGASAAIYDADVATVYFLDIAERGIKTLDGIEHFKNLMFLRCYGNELSELDVTALSALEELYCDMNGMTGLNVEGLSKLRVLTCSGNELSELDVTGLKALEDLNCGANKLTKLEVKGLSKMEVLYCAENELKELDLTGLVNLESLTCNNNQLMSLDARASAALSWLDCDNNRLTSLNVGGLIVLEALYCNDNRLRGLDVTGLAKLGTLECRNNYMKSEADVKGIPSGVDFSFLPQNPLPTGVSLKGRVVSYNPGLATGLALAQGGEVKYEAGIAPTDGAGQADQEFVFEGVAPGTYTLIVSKYAHASVEARNIIVGDTDVDLAASGRDALRRLVMPCGDMNSDNVVNSADLAILWRSSNYNKKAESAEEPLCDLNGDGFVNSADLAVLWLSGNYNRSAVTIE